MGRKKNSIYPPHDYECKDVHRNGHNPFTKIYHDLFLDQDKFTKLTASQRILWIFCDMRSYKNGAPNTPAADYPDYPGFAKDQPVFYMNYSFAESLLHVWSKNTFYKDIQALCDYGFIECICKQKKKKSIFRITRAWK